MAGLLRYPKAAQCYAENMVSYHLPLLRRARIWPVLTEGGQQPALCNGNVELSTLTPPALLALEVLPHIKETLGMGYANTIDVEPAGRGTHNLMVPQEAAEAFFFKCRCLRTAKCESLDSTNVAHVCSLPLTEHTKDKGVCPLPVLTQ